MKWRNTNFSEIKWGKPLKKNKREIERKSKYSNFNQSQLGVHLDLESRILTDPKSTKLEEEKAFKNIREIKKLLYK